jgi:ketosteroid isomerase-like protein
MSNENVELLRGAYEAFGRGDVPAVLAVLDEDIEWNAAPNVLPHGQQVRGRDEVGRFFQGLGSTWSDFSVKVDDYVASGDRICVTGRADGKLNGTQTGYGFVHSWTMADGSCVRFNEYVDPDAEVLAR